MSSSVLPENMEPAITSMCPERGARSWNISYFSTSAKLRLSTMSTALSLALSGLHSALQSEVPTEADLTQLESLLVQAHQAKFRAEVSAAKAQAEAQFAATQAELAQAQAAALAASQAAAQAAAQMQLQAQLAAAQQAAEAKLTAAVTAQIEGLTSGQPATQPTSQPANELPSQPANELPSQPTNELPSQPATQPTSQSAKSVNARFANLNAGLNDRLAFVKHLFGGDDQDYQRIVAYLATLESKEECETFIREAVQPDYDWSKSPDVAERFMALVYARFE
jgi:hypothetical protein